MALREELLLAVDSQEETLRDLLQPFRPRARLIGSSSIGCERPPEGDA